MADGKFSPPRQEPMMANGEKGNECRHPAALTQVLVVSADTNCPYFKPVTRFGISQSSSSNSIAKGIKGSPEAASNQIPPPLAPLEISCRRFSFENARQLAAKRCSAKSTS